MIYVWVPAFFFKLVWVAFSATQWFVTVIIQQVVIKKKEEENESSEGTRYLLLLNVQGKQGNKVMSLSL